MKRIILLFFSLLITCSLFSQSNLLTTAERSEYSATSTYDEVISFISVLEKQSDILRIEWIARTTEGRDIPMMVIANPMVENWQDAQNDDRVVVYIQANIHAGEIEGKEAAQMLARDLVKNPQSDS